MTPFIKHYRRLFTSFGYPLTKPTGLPSTTIAAAGKRLGVTIPAALRAFYLVAGRERRFNVCHNRLLAPQSWTTDRHRLIFMEENQQVVFWGVSLRNRDVQDPPVSQGVNDEPIVWRPEHRKCGSRRRGRGA